MKKLLCLLAVLALLAQPLRAEAAPQRYLALTFDDGPSGELTEQLLEGLAERQVHATFFVCAYRIAQFPDTLSHIAAAGHEIGLHSSNHDYMQKMDYETALSDLTRCAKAVEDACGVQARLFRPPGGLYGDTLLKAAEDAGLSVVLWSVDPCDWNEAAWDGVLPTVLSEAHDGRIILMHDLSAHSVTCALQAIDRLQARGYTFCADPGNHCAYDTGNTGFEQCSSNVRYLLYQIIDLVGALRFFGAAARCQNYCTAPRNATLF